VWGTPCLHIPPLVEGETHLSPCLPLVDFGYTRLRLLSTSLSRPGDEPIPFVFSEVMKCRLSCLWRLHLYLTDATRRFSVSLSEQERSFTTKSGVGRRRARPADRSWRFAGPRAGVGFLERGSKVLWRGSEPPPSVLHITYGKLGERRKLPQWEK